MACKYGRGQQNLLTFWNGRACAKFDRENESNVRFSCIVVVPKARNSVSRSLPNMEYFDYLVYGGGGGGANSK